MTGWGSCAPVSWSRSRDSISCDGFAGSRSMSASPGTTSDSDALLALPGVAEARQVVRSAPGAAARRRRRPGPGPAAAGGRRAGRAECPRGRRWRRSSWSTTGIGHERVDRAVHRGAAGVGVRRGAAGAMRSGWCGGVRWSWCSSRRACQRWWCGSTAAWPPRASTPGRCERWPRARPSGSCSGSRSRWSDPGGFTVWRTGTPLAVLVAVWSALTAVRITRGEEEAGRWNLLLAGRLRLSRLVGLQLVVIMAASPW